MKYRIFTDEGGYLKPPFFLHTNSTYDIYELEPTKMVRGRLDCYHLADGFIVLDEEKLAEQIKNETNEKRCIELHSLLDSTDWIMAKATEEMLSCTTLIGLVAVFKKILTEYKEQIENRKVWRKELEELEK